MLSGTVSVDNAPPVIPGRLLYVTPASSQLVFVDPDAASAVAPAAGSLIDPNSRSLALLIVATVARLNFRAISRYVPDAPFFAISCAAVPKLVPAEVPSRTYASSAGPSI